MYQLQTQKKIINIFDNTENRVSKLVRLIKSKEIVRVLESLTIH